MKIFKSLLLVTLLTLSSLPQSWAKICFADIHNFFKDYQNQQLRRFAEADPRAVFRKIDSEWISAGSEGILSAKDGEKLVMQLKYLGEFDSFLNDKGYISSGSEAKGLYQHFTNNPEKTLKELTEWMVESDFDENRIYAVIASLRMQYANEMTMNRIPGENLKDRLSRQFGSGSIEVTMGDPVRDESGLHAIENILVQSIKDAKAYVDSLPSPEKVAQRIKEIEVEMNELKAKLENFQEISEQKDSLEIELEELQQVHAQLGKAFKQRHDAFIRAEENLRAARMGLLQTQQNSDFYKRTLFGTIIAAALYVGYEYQTSK